MRISDQFPSDYLRAADLEGKELTLTIRNVAMEEVGADRENKPVLYFEGQDKGIILNKTNAATIAELYGDDTDEWPGEAITLFSAMVTYQGKTMPGLRVKMPSRKKGPKSGGAPPGAAPKQAAPSGVGDDEIPF
ncbi:MAG TPA: hypothetical protein VG758_21150 [Hyphomicrobiaceae bacterium]|jgi:hypothetical protein|nr:hypothetical protein [Hyphomicrobiaceae bacterium]